MPQRIQRKRTKGWRMPENTVSVTRPGRWGNPFVVGCCPAEFSSSLPYECNSIEAAVECFRYLAITYIDITGGEWISKLRGKNLACFCKIGDPCHADVLLELANK